MIIWTPTMGKDYMHVNVEIPITYRDKLQIHHIHHQQNHANHIVTDVTHWGRDKMDAIFQKTFSNAFY